ncbi:hypothetical protein ACJIZ3_021821 [Penstemon smallii]|uniref:non-specific serine/threonine protein kinase n=1 Tax=Penstemon smallii TaxID=265156 RepID=A0ABD3SMS6_9LAMI
MGSSRVICEIIEADDKTSTTWPRVHQLRAHDRDKKPPFQKKGPNKYIENDINKLFEAVNLRTTKSLDLSDSWRNASKKPMRSPGSHSPGIGFSEPVSLKQSLRGLCISQAAEMAAMKRLSVTSASPRVSEAGRITDLYRSVVAESGKSSCSSVKPIVNSTDSISSDSGCSIASGNSVAKSHVGGETALFSAKNPAQDPNAKSPIVHKDIAPESKSDKKISGSKSEDSNSSTSLRVLNKTVPKVRQKSRLQTVVTSSSTVKSNKDAVKPARNTSRVVKPAIRNKNLVMQKPKKVTLSTGANSKTSSKHSSEQLICQKCQCSMKDTNKDSSKDHPKTTSDAIKSDSIHIPFVKTNMNSKSSEKGGDITQSSQSSGFSSSTTSLSEESNPSGSICGNRPHMSKDMRWGAISRIRKQYGFLGLSHFNLLKKLGSGDIGTVYLAELIGTNCSFAIKVMDNEFLGRRKKMPRAQTEREILRMLDHPFLPTLYAQFTSDNLACLVMEFCPGGDLHVLRQKQPGRYFPEQAARFYVAEVLLALEYLHMLGIVYRDLKPENILVREDGHIMLTDFDLSLRCSVNPTLVKSSPSAMEPPRVSGPCAGSNCIDPFCAGPSCKVSCFSPRLIPSTARARKLKADSAAQARALPQLVAEPTEARSNSFVGTHEYLAPEIIKGEGHGSAVDWWTFGVFLYELLYGKTPFKGAGNEETLTNVVLQNLKFPDTPMVSFQARDLIRGLLVKEPENRFGTETGAAEIKRHSFFEGLNWALIRCAIPPQIPEYYGVGSSQIASSQEKEIKFMDFSDNGEHLEFELF